MTRKFVRGIAGMLAFCAMMIGVSQAAMAVNSPKTVLIMVVDSNGAKPTSNSVTIEATDANGQKATFSNGTDTSGIIAYDAAAGTSLRGTVVMEVNF